MRENSREKIAKIEFLMKWPPWPSASATQTNWMRPAWSNDACATPQWRPRHELAWIWTGTDFLSEQSRATGLVATAGGAARAGGKKTPARCSHKTQDQFAIASMAKKLLHRCIGAHARVHMHFCREHTCIFDRCCEHLHVQMCTLDRCCKCVHLHNAYMSVHICFTLATGCAYALMHLQFVHLALGDEDGGVQLVWVYESTCCLAWGVIFDIRKDRGVVCVFSISYAGGSVCGCMCVCTHTHTHTAQMGYSDVSSGVGTDTWRARRIQMY